MNFGNSYCKLPILVPKPLDSCAPELFEGYGYRQLIDIPTRVTNDTTSLIDLIYLDNIDNVTSHGTFPKIADHDGIFVSFHCTKENIPVRSRVIYDYTNVDEVGLTNYIKNIDFDTHVFSKPYIDQAKAFSSVLSDAFTKYVHSQTITIRPCDQPWTNTYTRLLLRKKNRNYIFFKKANSSYLHALSKPHTSPETVTILLSKKDKAYTTARESANQSKNANKRAKSDFYNSINSTMNNFHISAKKKFTILNKLLRTVKYSTIPPIVEGDKTVTDFKGKADILNNHFADKAKVNGHNDTPPKLYKFYTFSQLD